MARIRTIKPDFWESETIASLSRDARLLFLCTLNLADDEGLLRWTAPYLKAAAFMYDDDMFTESVSELMHELVNASLIQPYKGGKLNAVYGWIVSFHEHQKINRPTPSKLPPPSLQNPEIRKAYAIRDKMICEISGEEIAAFSSRHRGDMESLSLDHIVPKSKGGTDYPSNIRATKQSANKARGNREDKQAGSGDESLTESLTEPLTESLTEPLTAGKGKGKGKEKERIKDLSSLETEQKVFEHWKAATGKARAKFTDERRAKVRARLREGYSESEIQQAIDRVCASPYHCGKNDSGTTYNGLEMICDSGSKLEFYRDSLPEPGANTGANARAATARAKSDALVAWDDLLRHLETRRPLTCGELQLAALKKVGGASVLGGRSYFELESTRRAFVESYLQLAKQAAEITDKSEPIRGSAAQNLQGGSR